MSVDVLPNQKHTSEACRSFATWVRKRGVSKSIVNFWPPQNWFQPLNAIVISSNLSTATSGHPCLLICGRTLCCPAGPVSPQGSLQQSWVLTLSFSDGSIPSHTHTHTHTHTHSHTHSTILFRWDHSPLKKTPSDHDFFRWDRSHIQTI